MSLCGFSGLWFFPVGGEFLRLKGGLFDRGWDVLVCRAWRLFGEG